MRAHPSLPIPERGRWRPHTKLACPSFVVPGPSALAAALSLAGFDAGDAHFLGFLPRRAGERSRRLAATAATAGVLVFFESPRRLAKSLADLTVTLDDPPTVVCRELTKLHEETVRGPRLGASDALRGDERGVHGRRRRARLGARKRLERGRHLSPGDAASGGEALPGSCGGGPALRRGSRRGLRGLARCGRLT